MKVEKYINISEKYSVFPFRGKVYFFSKPIGNIRSRLSNETFEPIWTLDLPAFNFSETTFAFYDDFLIAPSRFIDLRTGKITIFSDVILNFRWSRSINEQFVLFGTGDNKTLDNVGVYDLNNRNILWNNEKLSIAMGVFSIEDIAYCWILNKKTNNYDGIISFNYLTGETLWQRSFKELGIANLDKFIGDINNILVSACGKIILGLDKNTGEELWRVNHYIEVANAVLNQASGCIYLFYGWSGPENSFSENDNITFLEIEALTGEVLYDNSIFKHPNYIELNGLRHYEGTGDYPRFYNALQWKHKIYFIINSWHSSMVKIMEFDTVNKRISHLTEQSYEANSNSNWFIAEGKLFIQSRISQQIESEKNPDPLYWSKIYSKSQFDGEQMHYQHFAISKESYLTIFDLEDN